MVAMGFTLLPLKYRIGGMRGPQKSVFMLYRCADRKSRVAMVISKTHENIIAPYSIFFFLKAPSVGCIDC